MPLIDSATLVVGKGNFLTAPIGTPIPTDLKSPGPEWTNIGHTSLEDVFGTDSEGGEVTTLGTLQNPTLRTSRSAKVETFNIQAQQFDIGALKLYYGSNAKVSPDGKLLYRPSAPAATEVAFLAVFLDGANTFAIYAPRSEIIGGDNMEIADTASLASLPLSITPLQMGANDYPYAITPMGTIPTWAKGTFAAGTLVKLSGGGVLEATVGGQSGDTAPTLPASFGGTVKDGAVTWKRISGDA